MAMAISYMDKIELLRRLCAEEAAAEFAKTGVDPLPDVSDDKLVGALGRLALMTDDAELISALAENAVEKARGKRSLKAPRIERGDPILDDRRRLPVTGMTLAAQAVTGQPQPPRMTKPNSNGVTKMDTASRMTALAKRDIDAGFSPTSKAEWTRIMSGRAAELHPRETPAVAFTKYIEGEEGRTLFAASQLRIGEPDHEGTVVKADDESFELVEGPKARELRALAEERARAYGESYEVAFTAVWCDTTHASLVQEVVDEALERQVLAAQRQADRIGQAAQAQIRADRERLLAEAAARGDATYQEGLAALRGDGARVPRYAAPRTGNAPEALA